MLKVSASKSLPSAFEGGTGEIAYLFIKVSSGIGALRYFVLSTGSNSANSGPCPHAG